MYLNKYLIITLFFALFFSCSDDDGQTDLPTLELIASETIKPESKMVIEARATAPNLIAADGITGNVVSGEGTLLRVEFTGEGSNSGSATFEFIAGSTENSNSLLEFRVTDEQGESSNSELEVEITALETTKVVVLNEGNFFSANGGLDVYDIKQQQVDNGVYAANATVQQAVQHQDNIYMVTNAPDGLDILNQQLESQAIITEGLDNPVDFAAVENTGYVSNWGDINTAFSDDPDSYVAIVDLQTREVTDSVILNARPQGILSFDEQVFVALEGGEAIAVIDTEDNSLTEIQVPSGPSEILVDNFGMIWVLCTSGSLVSINPATQAIVTSIDGLTTGGFNEKLAIDGTGGFIYFLGGTNGSFSGLTTVYQVDLSQEIVEVFIDGGFALYGIGVNPETNEIYIGDSNAFQSTGTGFRYDVQGNKLDEFATGIGPRGFIFQ